MDGGYNDGGRGLSMPAYDVELRVPPTTVSKTTFRADEPGEFEFRCSVYCGGGHDKMRGTLVVAE